jgi:hypothetical protein
MAKTMFGDPVIEDEEKQKRTMFGDPIVTAAPPDPRQAVRDKIQAGQTLSRKDMKALGVPRTNVKQRQIFADVLARSTAGASGLSGGAPGSRQDVAGAITEAPAALAAGTERLAGTVFGGLPEFEGRRGAASTIGQQVTQAARTGPVVSRILAPMIDAIVPKQVKKIFDKRNRVLTETGRKISDFFEEQATTGWEAADPELMKAKWDRPIQYATRVTGEAAPTTIAALGTGVLTKSPTLEVEQLSRSNPRRRQLQESRHNLNDVRDLGSRDREGSFRFHP